MPVKKRKSRKPKTSTKKTAEISELVAPDSSNQRRQLMWLGVGLSAVVIFFLWLLSLPAGRHGWQIGFPVRPAKSQAATAETGKLISDFQQAIDEAKSSLSNISQLIEQSQSTETEQSADEATEKLKVKILEQLKEQSVETASTTDEDGGRIIIFE